MTTIYVKDLSLCSLLDGFQRYTNGNIEHFKEEDQLSNEEKKLLGISTVTFIVLLLLNIFIWIWALKVLLQYKNEIPTWALIVAILGLVGFVIPGGPLVTLIIVYATRGTN